jgi:hypothetical protein
MEFKDGKYFGPMELLNDLEKACIIVQKGKNKEQRDNAVKALLYGTVDVDSTGAKELLHRRALFITMLRDRKIWGHPKKDQPPDPDGTLALV